jgi:hypothetical protein
MTPFDPDPPAPETADAAPVEAADDEFPARRLLAHDIDASWLDDEADAWRAID